MSLYIHRIKKAKDHQKALPYPPHAEALYWNWMKIYLTNTTSANLNTNIKSIFFCFNSFNENTGTNAKISALIGQVISLFPDL